MNKIISVSLNNLLLNIDNPRNEPVENQQAAIDTMVKLKESKLLNLAKHIDKYGLNPSDLIIVKKHKDNLYVTLEGNRRVTALKLWDNPELLTNIDPKLKEDFKEFKKTHPNNITSDIDVIVLDEDKANIWIELKHTNESDGTSTITWNPVSKERFRESIGKKTSTATQLINYVKKSNLFNDNIKSNINTIKTTNLQRLLDDPGVRKNLGLETEKGILKKIYPDSEIVLGLEHILEDLLDDKINVTDIYYKEDRKKYIDSIDKDILPKTEHKLLKADNLIRHSDNIKSTKDDSQEQNIEKNSSANTDANDKNKDSNTIDEKDKNKVKVPRRPQVKKFFGSLNWGALDPNNPNDIGIISICNEIKNLSISNDYKKYPMATTIVLRALLEQTIIFFIEKNKENKVFYRKATIDSSNNIKFKQLGVLITELSKSARNSKDPNSIFHKEDDLKRTFSSVIDNIGTKDYMDMVIHNPSLVKANANTLDQIAECGLFGLINSILNKDYNSK